jgi:hypothetical protein
LVSDHCPFLLVGNTNCAKYKGFRFEAYWPRLPGYLEVVAEAWNKPLSVTNPFLRLHTKMHRTAKVLRAWARSKIGNCKLLIIAARQLIWIFDVVQEYRPLSSLEVQLHRQIKQRRLGLTAVEKLRAKQCSRLTMIKASSCNSKLFFLRANARKRKSYIQSLQVEGRMVFTHQQKCHAAHTHFSNLFGAHHLGLTP